MGVEIERKFLVKDESWRVSALPGTRYSQGYLASSPRCSVRVRTGGERAWLNIKGATVGASRAEFEYPLPLADAKIMLETLCEASLVDKTRYLVVVGAHTWEVDVFHGANDGLVMAEIELARVDESFERPPWAGEEVTADVRYYNARLAVHPYCEWRGAAPEQV